MVAREGEGERGACELQGLVAASFLGGEECLDLKAARLELTASGAHCLLVCASRQVADRVSVVVPQALSCEQPLAGGIGKAAAARERVRSLEPRRQGLRPGSLQLVDRRQLAFCLGEPRAIVECSFRELLPCPDCLRELAAELGTAAEHVEHRQPAALVFPLRPELEPGAACGRRIAVSVQVAVPARGLEKQRPCALPLTGCEPVLGNQAGLRAAGIKQLCQRAMQGAAPGPGGVRVNRLAHEVVSEGREPRLALDQEPLLEQLPPGRRGAPAR